MKRGVDFYSHYQCTVDVFFPNGIVDCQHCPYIRYYDGLRRYRCSLTDEYIYEPFGCVGNNCKLTPIEEGGGQDGNPGDDLRTKRKR